VQRRVERDLEETPLRTHLLLLNILNKAMSGRTIE
jgi:hypothetical protein